MEAQTWEGTSQGTLLKEEDYYYSALCSHYSRSMYGRVLDVSVVFSLFFTTFLLQKKTELSQKDSGLSLQYELFSIFIINLLRSESSVNFYLINIIDTYSEVPNICTHIVIFAYAWATIEKKRLTLLPILSHFRYFLSPLFAYTSHLPLSSSTLQLLRKEKKTSSKHPWLFLLFPFPSYFLYLLPHFFKPIDEMIVSYHSSVSTLFYCLSLVLIVPNLFPA